MKLPAPEKMSMLLIALILSLIVSYQVSAYEPWEWKAANDTEFLTFQSKAEAVARMEVVTNNGEYLTEETGVDRITTDQHVWFKFVAEPKDPVIGVWEYSTHFFDVELYATEAEYVSFLKVKYESQLPANCAGSPVAVTPDGDWYTPWDGWWYEIVEDQDRNYDVDTWGWSSTLETCIPMAAYDGGSRRRPIACESPFWSRLAIPHCFLPDIGKVTGRPLIQSCSVGNPCDVGSGDKLQKESDYTGPGPSLERTYHSFNSEKSTGLGVGWRHNYQARITVYGGNPSGLIRGDGHQDTLRYSATDTYIAYENVDLIIKKEADQFVVYQKTGAREIYDATGALVELVDEAGRSTTITYNTGQVDTVTGPFGHQLKFNYDSSGFFLGRLESVQTPDGQLIQYAYDSRNNLTTVAHEDGSVRTYHYEDIKYANHLTGITDENGDRFAMFAYDLVGRAISTEHVGGYERLTLSYEANGDTLVTDAAGNIKTYSFTTDTSWAKRVNGTAFGGQSTSIAYAHPFGDQRRRILSTTNERGVQTSYTYDTYHKISKTEAVGTAEERLTSYLYLDNHTSRLAQVTSPSVFTGNDRQVITAYNAAQLPESVTIDGYRPDGTAVSRSISFRYNTNGQITSVDGPRTDDSDTTKFSYYNCATGAECGQLLSVTNALGHVTTYDSYDAAGRLTQSTDPNGLVTTYIYDLRGRVTTISQSPSGGTARTMLMTYDNAGQLKTNTSPAGVTLTYTYDAAHNLLSVTDELGNHIDYTYDLKGNQAEEKIYDASNVLKRTLTKTYDIWDNIDTINNGSSITDLLFDALGNLDSETDANLNATTNNYDPLNRLTDTLDALSGSTVYGYDVTDNLTSVHAPNGALTTYEYDDLGNLLSESSPDRGQIFYTHDIAGNVVGVTDARGVTTTYSYDVLNRVTKTQYPDASENVTYTFDTGTSGIARLAAIADQSGITSYGYNTFGDVVSDVKVIDGVSYTTSYLYDGAGNITDITYPDGRIVSYVRDAAGQLTQVNTSVDSVTTAIISNAAYEPFGPVTSMTYANGVSMDYAYDQAYRVTGITMNGLLDKSYGLDPVGNILGITDLVDPAMNQSFTYDALNRLETDQGNYAGDAFTYDANGNRTSDSSGTYDYLSLSNRLTAIAGESVVLDAAGNTTSLRGMDLAYNDSGRLQSVSAAVTTKYRGKPKTTITEVGVYTYNALGQRVKKIANGRSTIYHYDLGGNLILETTDGGVAETSYLWLGNRPVAQIGPVTTTTRNGKGNGNGNGKGKGNGNGNGKGNGNGNGNGKGKVTTTTEERLTYLHSDHLATVRSGTDDTGKIVWRWDGDGFGGVAADGDPDGDGSNVTLNLRFPGQYFDAESGLHYNYFRFYDPGTGRYVSTDPLGQSAAINLFVYAKNSPIVYFDPYGLYCLTQVQINAIAASIGGGFGGLVSGAITGAVVGGIPGAIALGLAGAVRGAGVGMASAIVIQQVGAAGGVGMAAVATNSGPGGKARSAAGAAVGAVAGDLLGDGATAAAVSGALGGAIGTDPVTGAVGGATGGIAGAIAARILAAGNDCEDECGE